MRKQALEALTQYETGVPVAGIVRLLADPDAELRHSAAHARRTFRRPFGWRGAGAARARSHRPTCARRRSNRSPTCTTCRTPRRSCRRSAIANADVRQQALEALRRAQGADPRGDAARSSARSQRRRARSKAAEFAGERSAVAAIPSLRRMIDDENRDVRENAVSALANIGDEAAVAALRAGLASKDAKVRRAAAEALGDRRQ